MMINKKILNTENMGLTSYPLFMGEELGLHNTVFKQYPQIWDKYKDLKSLDWAEDEFDYSSCNADFKRCGEDIKNMMIETLSWQWEADTVASRSIVPALAPFITSSELWAYIQFLGVNETVHANTYSEIVRLSFDDSDVVMQQIHECQESLARLDNVAQVFHELYLTSHKYALGLADNNQETYNTLYKSWVALLLLERIQFIASFAITFTVCNMGIFIPIGDAVKKIAQDELEVHAVVDRMILDIENKTEQGKIAKETLQDDIVELFHSVVDAELHNVDYIFRDGRALLGTNADIVKKWVLFNAKFVAKYLEIDTKYKYPTHNPMPQLEKWLDVNKIQGAPQEQQGSQTYKTGIMARDDDNVVFDVDF